MIKLDLFSGIGGFSKGFLDAGYKITKHYFSEVDRHAIANYKYNFKNAEYVGSVVDVRGSELERPNIITFGSPCQDFSLAGKRTGLEGDRSSLILEAIRVVGECRPDVFIWENVKGAFSSNEGADFQAILTAFANIGGYRLEWQLLNTVWFLPQNRERIYLIGHLDGRSRPKVFPIRESDFGHHEPQREPQREGQRLRGYDSQANCLLKSDYKDGRQNLIQIAAMRGRNPENPKSRAAKLNTEQQLEINDKGISNTLTSVQKDNMVINQKARGYNKGGDLKVCPTISSNSFQHNNHVNSIRRLTEIEYERLQGFPDDWTKYGIYDGEVKEISKTQRYKMCGNAVTVAVVAEIAKRLDLKIQ